MRTRVLGTTAAMPDARRGRPDKRAAAPGLLLCWGVWGAVLHSANGESDSDRVTNAMQSGSYLYESKLGSDRMIPYMIIYIMWIAIVFGGTLAIFIWIRIHNCYKYRREKRLERESGYSTLPYRDPERYERMLVQLERMPITAFDNVAYSKMPAAVARRREKSLMRRSTSWLMPRFSLPGRNSVTPYSEPYGGRDQEEGLQKDIDAVLREDSTPVGKGVYGGGADSDLRAGAAHHPRPGKTLARASSGDIDL